jgi:hypothetical protein
MSSEGPRQACRSLALPTYNLMYPLARYPRLPRLASLRDARSARSAAVRSTYTWLSPGT